MTLSDWRDLSLILLALEGVIIALIYGAIFYYLWKGFRFVHRWLQRVGFPQGQRYSMSMKVYTLYYSRKVAKPLAAAESLQNQAAGFIRAFFNLSQNHSRSQQ